MSYNYVWMPEQKIVRLRAMKNKTIAILLTITALACVYPGRQTIQGQEANSAKIGRLLESSGYGYSKADKNVWAVHFEGEELKKFDVVVFSQEKMLVMFAIVAEKKDLTVSPELMQRMLRLNSDFDRVKVGIDKDGDAFVRVDLSIRIVDNQEFKENVEQVAAAANETFKAIKQFVTATK